MRHVLLLLIRFYIDNDTTQVIQLRRGDSLPLCTQATEVDDQLKATAGLLPPLAKVAQMSHTAKNTAFPSSPRGHHTAAASELQGPGTPPRSDSPKPGNAHGWNQALIGAGGTPPTVANRRLRISPNGAVLNTSIDTALAGAIRPKVSTLPATCDPVRDLGNSAQQGRMASQGGGFGHLTGAFEFEFEPAGDLPSSGGAEGRCVGRPCCCLALAWLTQDCGSETGLG